LLSPNLTDTFSNSGLAPNCMVMLLLINTGESLNFLANTG
jgi:hypothetical protein